MRICPDNLGETFTHGINGFQLAERLRNLKEVNSVNPKMY
jgi:hypothetical protein